MTVRRRLCGSTCSTHGCAEPKDVSPWPSVVACSNQRAEAAGSPQHLQREAPAGSEGHPLRAGQSKLTAQDIENIEEVAARPDALRRLAASLAPSIHGHQLVKAGLVLQLLGGRERVLDNGTHLRGDLNCLMVRAGAPGGTALPVRGWAGGVCTRKLRDVGGLTWVCSPLRHCNLPGAERRCHMAGQRHPAARQGCRSLARQALVHPSLSWAVAAGGRPRRG